jgi:hypothetical protein
MSILLCPKCKQSIVAEGDACPECGLVLSADLIEALHSYHDARPPNHLPLIMGGIAFLVLGVVVGTGAKRNSPARSTSSSPSPAHASYSAGPSTTSYRRSSFRTITPWYEGGSLHNATVSEWQRASDANKVATAADWLAATKWDGHLTSHAAMDRMHGKARQLADAVDGATVDLTSGDLGGVLKAKEIAAAIITMSNDLGPN